MTINGFNIKKYRARVKDRSAQTTSPELGRADGYKIVEGYVATEAVIISHGTYGNFEQRYVPVFYSEEIDFGNMPSSGFGKSIFKTVYYREGTFEVIGEV